MCVIVTVPKDSVITREDFESCWNANPHGGGLMYSDGKKVIVKKVLRNERVFWQQYLKAKREAVSDIVLHFRISTSGKIDENNVHPFPLENGYWLCHNGILSVTVPKNSKINDTQIFIRDYLPGLDLENEMVRITIGRLIGSYNKLVIMSPKGHVLFVNKQSGINRAALWFSNMDWVKKWQNFEWFGL